MRLQHLRTCKHSYGFAVTLLMNCYSEANSDSWFMDRVVSKEEHVERQKKKYHDAIYNWSHIVEPKHLKLVVEDAEDYAKEMGWEVFPRPALMRMYEMSREYAVEA